MSKLTNRALGALVATLDDIILRQQQQLDLTAEVMARVYKHVFPNALDIPTAMYCDQSHATALIRAFDTLKVEAACHVAPSPKP